MEGGWEGSWVESGGGAHLGHARHAAVLVADLAEHAALVEAGKLAEVDGGLGVPVALEHAALARSQREDVAGPVEVAGHGRRAREGAEGGGAVEGRDPGRRALLRADNRGAGVRHRVQHGRERPGKRRLTSRDYTPPCWVRPPNFARLHAALLGSAERRRTFTSTLTVKAVCLGSWLLMTMGGSSSSSSRLPFTCDVQPAGVTTSPSAGRLTCGSAPQRKSLRRSTA